MMCVDKDSHYGLDHNVINELQEMIDSNRLDNIHNILEKMDSVQLAYFLSTAINDHREKLINALDHHSLSNALVHVVPDLMEEVIEILGIKNTVELLVSLSVEDIVTIIKATDNFGYTVLFTVANHSHLELAKILLEKGAEINAVDKYGLTVLHHAAWNGHWDTVKWLVEQEADLQAKDEVGETVLHWAAKNGHWEWVKWLVEKGADLQAKNNDGETVLHYAAHYGHGYCQVVGRARS